MIEKIFWLFPICVDILLLLQKRRGEFKYAPKGGFLNKLVLFLSDSVLNFKQNSIIF